jgi:hypothetical protein
MGVVAGLVAITPGAGYVPIWSALIFGVLAGICSSLATKLKHILPIDDAMDVFAVHAVGGLVGNICTGESKLSRKTYRFRPCHSMLLSYFLLRGQAACPKKLFELPGYLPFDQGFLPQIISPI